MNDASEWREWVYMTDRGRDGTQRLAGLGLGPKKGGDKKKGEERTGHETGN